jgi:hypothetical protein
MIKVKFYYNLNFEFDYRIFSRKLRKKIFTEVKTHR